MSAVSPALWAILAGLLALSALFSGSEAALFSLTPRQRLGAGRHAQRLLRDPRGLLVTLLLCNNLVNVLFFAFAGRLGRGAEGAEAALIGLAVLLVLVIGGEILPKILGLRARQGLARAVSPVLRSLVGLFGPLARPLARALEVLGGWITPLIGSRLGVTAEMLARVMERGQEEGVLLGTEADLLAELVELEGIRVREIMTPRVDALFLPRDGANRAAVVREALARRQSWLPVIDEDPDRVVGRIRVRDLLRHPDRPIARLVMPVKFVPEVASALDLLGSLRKDRTEEAVVVDEWGGTAGFVTAEDVFEEIVGELRPEGETRMPPVVPLGENRYRVAGGLSVRSWNEAFGQTVVPWEFETVGGLVAALLGRIPHPGDRTRIGGIEMQVQTVHGRRVHAVDVWVPVPAEEGKG
ncbi:MAG: hemolysin family protein [Planctomycetota bacterium]